VNSERDPGLRVGLDDRGATLLVVSAARCQRHPFAGGVHQLLDAEHDDESAAHRDPGNSACNRTTTSALKWTVGMFWSLSRELSIEQLYDPKIVPFWTALFGSSPFDYPLFQDANGNANYYCTGGHAGHGASAELRHLLQPQQELRPPARRIRRADLQA
jgi:hypothetical protein